MLISLISPQGLNSIISIRFNASINSQQPPKYDNPGGSTSVLFASLLQCQFSLHSAALCVMCVLSVSLAATIKTKSNEGSNPRVEITTGDAHRELAMGYLN